MTFSLKILQSWYFKWILVAIFIRLILAATTLHPDLWAFSLSGKIFVEEGVLNIYKYLYNLPQGSPYLNYGRDFFTYPPLTYFVLGFFRFFLNPFFGTGFYENLFTNFGGAFNILGIFQHALLVKLPYLIFDLPIAFLLTEFFKEEKMKRLAFLFWILNPVSLYTSFMIGQFDVIPTFFVVLSLVLAQKNKSSLALISLGVGGAFKVFPLLLIPFTVIILGKNIRERLKLLALGSLPYALTVLPFISSQAFRSTALFSSQSQKFLYAQVNLSGADVLYLFLVFYFILLFFAIGLSAQRDILWKFYLAVFLLLFASTNYHPQWFLWVMPLLIVFLVNNPEKWFLPILLFALFIGVTLFFEPSLSVGLFAPLFPSLVKAQGLSAHVRFIEPHQAASVLRSIFAATSIWLILEMFVLKKKVNG